MDFTPAPDERSLPQVALSYEDLGSLSALSPEEARTALEQMGFDFAIDRTDIPHYIFTSGVLSSIGHVATAEGEIPAKQPLIAGFYEGSKSVSDQ